MRLGVLDVGSNTIHLQVVDAHRGAKPIPATSHKTELHLTDYLDAGGSISIDGIQALTSIIKAAMAEAAKVQTEEILTFATSAIRDATNGERVINHINENCGIELSVLSGEEEARFTFLAARRWFGWSSGDLMVIDIGGGSLELATGRDEEPALALSLPLGAGRLTHNFIKDDPITSKSVRELEDYIDEYLETPAAALAEHEVDKVVGTSKTLRTLAKMSQDWLGDSEKRLTRDCLDEMVPKLLKMKASERNELPGVSKTRAHQIVAGAMVARQTLHAIGVDQIQICPWALREGVILKRLDWLEV
jgi:exopolyphosphatase/guanosine-5'-triphosphate,3'-diphosphate pyrophosphatase